MLIFRGLHIGLRKEKIQGTYFKICALNFEICPTYFDASAKVMKICTIKLSVFGACFLKASTNFRQMIACFIVLLSTFGIFR